MRQGRKLSLRRLRNGAVRMPAAAAVALALAAPIGPGAAAEVPKDAAGYVESLELLAYRQLDGSNGDRRAAVRALVLQQIDLESLARRAAGPYWQRVGEARRAAWRQTVRTLVSDLFARVFEDFDQANLEVTRVAATGPRVRRVDSVVHRTDAAPLEVTWEVRARPDGDYRITDVQAYGMSLIGHLRDKLARDMRHRAVNSVGR